MKFALLGTLLLATNTSGPDGVSLSQWFNFAQFGLLGVIFLMIVSKKWIVPKWALDDARAAYERELRAKEDVIAQQRADIIDLKNTVHELQDLTKERMIPALVQANALSAAYVQELSRRASFPVNPFPIVPPGGIGE